MISKNIFRTILILLAFGLSGTSFGTYYHIYLDSLHVYDDDRVLLHVVSWQNTETGDHPLIAGYHDPYCWLGHPSTPPSDRLLEGARFGLGMDASIMAQIHVSGSTCWVTELRIHQEHIRPR